MNQANRRKQMASLCRWLMEDFKTQTAMAKTIGVPQSMVSGYLAAKPDTAIPEDDTKANFAKYMRDSAPKAKQCAKWDVAEFTRYMDSDLSPQVFTAALRDKPVTTRMSVKDIASSLTDIEKLEFMEIVLHDLKQLLGLELISKK